MDNGASLCAATPALFATLIEAIATSDGAVAIDTYGGTLENHALRMAAYAARGTADLLLAGQQPEEIRKEVATEGGATRQGLNALDRMKVAEALRKFMTEIFAAAGTLESEIECSSLRAMVLISESQLCVSRGRVYDEFK